jgi:HSP20 family protein
MVFIKRWEPWKEFIDKFFEEDIISYPLKFATDVYETNKDIIVEIEVPGYQKDNIKISFQDGYLKVEGKTDETKEEKDKNYWRKEIRKGSFVKVVPLPKDIDSKKAKASFNNGILKINLPKLIADQDSGEEIKIE